MSAGTGTCSGQYNAHGRTARGHERGPVPDERRGGGRGGRAAAQTEAQGDAVLVRIPRRRARLPRALPGVQTQAALRARVGPGVHVPVPDARPLPDAGADAICTGTGPTNSAAGASAAATAAATAVPAARGLRLHSESDGRRACAGARHSERERLQIGSGCAVHLFTTTSTKVISLFVSYYQKITEQYYYCTDTYRTMNVMKYRILLFTTRITDLNT